MKRHPWSTLVVLFISLLLYCCGNGSEIISQDDDSGNLISAKVLGSFENIHVGDSIQFRAEFEASGPVDTGEIEYRWRLQQDDSVMLALNAGEFADWVPQTPGQYLLSLDIAYRGRTVSVVVIVIVLEKIVYVDANLTARLSQVADTLAGYYVGDVTTPGATCYRIAMIIQEDGSYHAYNTESELYPVLLDSYPNDGCEKRWDLTDIAANGTVSGKETHLCNGHITAEYILRDVQFNIGYDTLRCSLWYGDRFGPVIVTLARIDSSELPPPPLPTPTINVSWDDNKDSATYVINGPDSLSIVYQIIPVPPEGANLTYPDHLWRSDLEAVPYHGPFTLLSTGESYVLLARTTNCTGDDCTDNNGTRFGGVAAYLFLDY